MTYRVAPVATHTACNPGTALQPRARPEHFHPFGPQKQHFGGKVSLALQTLSMGYGVAMAIADVNVCSWFSEAGIIMEK